MLTLSIVSVTAVVEGAAGAKAVCHLLAEPADAQSALQSFRCVRDAKDSSTPEQTQALATMLLPCQSMDAVVKDLDSAAEALGLDAGAAADAMAGPAAGAAEEVVVGSLEEAAEDGATAKAEGAEDEWGKFKDVAMDALVEHEVDWAADHRRFNASAPSVACAAHPLEGGAVTTTAHVEREFFAGLPGWGFDDVASKLVAYVTASYPPARACRV